MLLCMLAWPWVLGGYLGILETASGLDSFCGIGRGSNACMLVLLCFAVSRVSYSGPTDGVTVWYQTSPNPTSVSLPNHRCIELKHLVYTSQINPQTTIYSEDLTTTAPDYPPRPRPRPRPLPLPLPPRPREAKLLPRPRIASPDPRRATFVAGISSSSESESLLITERATSSLSEPELP